MSVNRNVTVPVGMAVAASPRIGSSAMLICVSSSGANRPHPRAATCQTPDTVVADLTPHTTHQLASRLTPRTDGTPTMPGPLMNPETFAPDPDGPGASDATTVRRSAPRLVNPPSPDVVRPARSPSCWRPASAPGCARRLPKVLHPLCGRPMLAYVLDAWASTADGAAGGRPVVVYSPAGRGDRRRLRRSRHVALQDEPRGTGDAVARRARGRPGRRRPRSSSCPATCRW